MSEEREVRIETDFWGNEKEVIYESGEKVGEYKFEDRGGVFGIGGERVKVEVNTHGDEVGYTRQEERGGFFGIGAENVEVKYNSRNEEVGYSRVEERGGFLGIGTHHKRVGYDTKDNEVSQTNWEKRGGFLGIGQESIRVTHFNNNATKDRGYMSDSTSYNNDTDSNYSPHNHCKNSQLNQNTNKPDNYKIAEIKNKKEGETAGRKALAVLLLCIFFFPIFYGEKMDKITEDIKDENKFKLFILYLFMLPILMWAFYIDVNKPIEKTEPW